jgi:hypothetical protein
MQGAKMLFSNEASTRGRSIAGALAILLAASSGLFAQAPQVGSPLSIAESEEPEAASRRRDILARMYDWGLPENDARTGTSNILLHSKWIETRLLHGIYAPGKLFNEYDDVRNRAVERLQRSLTEQEENVLKGKIIREKYDDMRDFYKHAESTPQHYYLGNKEGRI